MGRHQARWGKTIFWGIVTAAIYVALFADAEFILRLAHTTPESCVVGDGAQIIYYHKVDAVACAARGGRLEPGHPWQVLVPILIAFAVSLVHGAFTGLFWEMMGLKPATQPTAKETA